ncbi:hypothetical protein [Salinarimonas soli]|uniref:Uncharacterized protein n=1 Tax=Salinarimonas soli TaxID=1638099 RepID=A0A5B2V9M3_9HYPH|nr:hypothetical protein [Salinarimonas soli]KAA2235072.1 hypothetical protein F0L46_22330 [Salinarimonas soli]
MRRAARLLLAALAIALAGPALAQAPIRVNVLALGSDGEPTSVPRGHRLYARIVAQLNEALSERRFRLYDETAVTASFVDPAGGRRTDAALVDIARAVSEPPLDVVMIFTIHASARRSSVTGLLQPQMRIAGRMLGVRDGRVLAAFSAGADQRLPGIPGGCDPDCLLERLGDQARPIVRELAGTLSVRLEDLVAPRPAPPAPAAAAECGAPATVMIELRGFEPAEIERLEPFFGAFRCYDRHRRMALPDGAGAIWYEARTTPERVAADVAQALGFLGLAAAPAQISDGTVAVVRNRTP